MKASKIEAGNAANARANPISSNLVMCPNPSSLEAGELESLTRRAAHVFRPRPWTYTYASPTAWVGEVLDGAPRAAL
jgi:hypothetical protein